MSRPYVVDDCSVCGEPMPCPATVRAMRLGARPRVCSVDGCNDTHWARGLCNRHYGRARYAETHPGARRYRERAR